MIGLFKHILPRSRAWSLTANKPLRQLFEALLSLVTDARLFSDRVLNDQNPQLTRLLPDYEAQFGLPDINTSEQVRRDRLEAEWSALGGQSPRYIQDTLQAAGFDVYVHDWWQLPVVGSPVPRNPLTYLSGDQDDIAYLMNEGAADVQDNDAVSQDGSAITPRGYPLVNIISTVNQDSMSDGSEEFEDGGLPAEDGGLFLTYDRQRYEIPNDPTKWPFFIYIGGQSFPNVATVLESRRDEFERLCLKICPTGLWIGILVEYN